MRRAFSRAINRELYVEQVRNGVGVPALGWLPPGIPGYDASVGADLSFDPDAARELLAQAGYPDGDGFPTVTISIVDSDPTRLTAQFLQQELKQQLNVNLEIETLEEGVFDQRFGSGDFQMVWQSWFADYADPENWLPEQFATDGGLNIIGYSNPQVDDLLTQAATELDQGKRLALYDQAHRLIVEDQAVTPVFHPEGVYLVKRNVGGLIITGLDAEPGDWFATNVEIFKGDAPPASLPE